MKKMLIIEEPESCETCPLRSYSDLMLMCTPMREAASDVECPLKSLPQKKEVEVNEIEDIMHTEYSIEDIYTNKYIVDIRLATDKLISLGWNYCLEELEK